MYGIIVEQYLRRGGFRKCKRLNVGEILDAIFRMGLLEYLQNSVYALFRSSIIKILQIYQILASISLVSWNFA